MFAHLHVKLHKWYFSLVATPPRSLVLPESFVHNACFVPIFVSQSCTTEMKGTGGPRTNDA